jgi:hypothetical protein
LIDNAFNAQGAQISAEIGSPTATAAFSKKVTHSQTLTSSIQAIEAEQIPGFSSSTKYGFFSTAVPIAIANTNDAIVLAQSRKADLLDQLACA